MKKNLFFAAMALTLSAGVFTACSSNEIDEQNLEGKATGTTYMSLQFAFPSNANRAANDGQDKNDPDYNHIGKWAGKDKIAGVKVYVFDASGKLEASPYFAETELDFVNGESETTNLVKPKKGIRVTPGNKTVYVVVNPTPAANTLLASEATETGFAAKYTSSEMVFQKGGMVTDPTSISAASEVAAVIGVGGEQKEQILMTGEPAKNVSVTAGVKETEAVGGQNTAKVVVKRAVARVMVSSQKATFDILGDNPETPFETETNYKIATVSDIKYVVAQGERKLYFAQQVSDEPNLWAYKTPASSFVPTNNNFNVLDGADALAAAQHYDYSTLWREHKTIGISGLQTPVKSDYAGNLDNITADLAAGLSGEVILPNTHKYGAEADNTSYRFGNTAYVLVRAKLTPTVIYDKNGEDKIASLGENDNIVLGANHIFYTDREAATLGKKGVKGQTTQLFTGRKVLYYAWVNPDKKSKGWLNSPVVRNNIYHIEIAGFKRIGGNWNPLVPGDPSRPENPDPKPQPDNPTPENPGEPDNPPVDPNNPLTPTETWMAVQAKILPWQVHSYSVELGD
ncbi:fimbrial protein [Alloprevotella sp. OH1205_COT-284]|uniref:Mfa1 family fimbria major subunit n=1 Tax=Alloprevotella sp. OH1205_COT-284 TaxID=2491043 RepID=UPI000F5FCA1E|nr:Mfa1 family fimbria major subunit [Alloprevotella sp. OH1205_COT-284]RRD80382.1 fimbrial protein [Alloprevotella sp. OH1205_COT-284]